jgi:hypothetical protein
MGGVGNWINCDVGEKNVYKKPKKYGGKEPREQIIITNIEERMAGARPKIDYVKFIHSISVSIYTR